MKSGNLNFLEPSGPLQACSGTALPIDYVLHGNVYHDGNEHLALRKQIISWAATWLPRSCTT